MADVESQRTNGCWMTLKFIGFYWRAIFFVVWPPICALVFLLGIEPKFRCLFVVLVMSGYWITECLPLFVTGMFPIFLMPLLEIRDTATVCKLYFHPTNMMFMGGLLIAISIEHCGLHNRIALCTIMRVGCSPRKLHFGLTFVTMFLSMWLINAATTAMMVPIIKAVLEELESQGIGTVNEPVPAGSDEEPRPTKISIAYYLTAAYASTIGGIGCLVGTGTNLVYKGLYETRFPLEVKIEFVNWLLFAAPGMLIMTAFMWFFLQIQLMGMFRKSSNEWAIVQKGIANKDIAYRILQQKMKDLGPMTWHESAVGVLFLLVICLWFFRSPQFISGWGDLYSTNMVKDATPAILVIALLIAIPASLEFFYFCSKDPAKRPTEPSPGLVTWKVYQTKMSWGLLFLLGGGFAVADASNASGMAAYLGEKLGFLKDVHWLIVLGLSSLMSSFATELTSNVAICNILVPVLLEMSMAMGVHPTLFTMPAAINCSFAFLMPVGTPANAIVAEAANIRTSDMVKNGILTKLMAWLVVYMLWPTYGRVFIDITAAPIVAPADGNGTTVSY